MTILSRDFVSVVTPIILENGGRCYFYLKLVSLENKGFESKRGVRLDTTLELIGGC